MIVVDSNLLVYFLIPGINTPDAVRVRSKDKIWVAPPLIRYELLNVLVKHVRSGSLPRDAAARAYKRGLAMLEVSTLEPDLIAIMNMVERTDCSTYDLQFVWLAMELGISLVTYDNEVLVAFPDLATRAADFK